MNVIEQRHRYTLSGHWVPFLMAVILLMSVLPMQNLLLGMQETVSEGIGERNVFVRVNNDGLQDMVGALVNEDANQITINDLTTGKNVTLPKTDRLTIEKPLDINEAVQHVGLAAVVGWRLSQLAALEKPVGKIALISGDSVFVILDETIGLEVGQKLNVYRKERQLKRPGTGDVFGALRSKIAEVEVVETKPELTKTRYVANGDFTTLLEVGDEVDLAVGGMKVAVSPIRNEDGLLTTVGSATADELSNALVNRNVSLVERPALNQAMAELAIPSTQLFDVETAREIGQLTGASYVLAGKIVPEGNQGMLDLRLIHVATGKLVFDVSTSVDISNAEVVTEDSATLLQEKVINLTGAKRWENSGITVEKGQRVSVSAPSSSANRNKRANYYGTVAHVGALIVKVGDQVLEIDKGKDFVASESGTIYFRNNLRRSPNHTADITVKVYQREP